MAYSQIIEGASEDVASQLQHNYAGQRVRVFVQPAVDEYTEDLPTPPFALEDKDDLFAMLVEGMHSPTHEVTDDTWDYIRCEVRNRSRSLTC